MSTLGWKSRVVQWGWLFGRVGSTPQECCLLRTSSKRFYGSYTSSTSFMNYSPWAIVLVIIWTYWMLPNNSTGKLRFHNVSTQAHFDMFPFPLKIVDWLTMTSTSTLDLSLDWSSSWIHRKETNLLHWLAICPNWNCLQMLLWNWRKLLQNITVNNFSTILDAQLRSLTTSMRWTITNFDYASLFVVFFFLQLQYTVLSMIELVTWQQSSEFYISLLLPFIYW